jgi:dihydrofolate reductase
MRRIVVTEFVSLDGVMEAPGPDHAYKHAGWTFGFSDPEQMKYKLDETMEHDALLLGRVTYEGFAAAWPKMKDDVGFADKMNSMPKYVVSSGSPDLSWNNSTLIAGDVPAEIAKLKQTDGGDILVAGSARLVQTLAAHDLVDEYRLMVFPVLLGSGRRLFSDAETDAPTKLKLVDSRAYASGTTILTYHPAR